MCVIRSYEYETWGVMTVHNLWRRTTGPGVFDLRWEATWRVRELEAYCLPELQANFSISIPSICITAFVALSFPARLRDYGQNSITLE